jgi:hypothetical protein
VDDAPPKSRFPATRWLLANRWSRRIFLALFLIVALVVGGAHLSMYWMARKTQAVLHGLKAVRIDETSESQLTDLVPYLTKREWTQAGVSHRGYFARISNDWEPISTLPWQTELFFWIERTVKIRELGNWVGYTLYDFDLWIDIHDGKVSKIAYSIDNSGGYPRLAGQTGLVAVRSVHSFWSRDTNRIAFDTMDDVSPQYRPRSWPHMIRATYTSDAPPDLTGHLFELDLRCLWSFFARCDNPQQLAPEMDVDAKSIAALARNQIQSGKCPDSIVEGRMKYLPDITVTLLEVSGTRQVNVTEDDGGNVSDWFTDYKFKEAIRGTSAGPWTNIRHREFIPVPGQDSGETANQMYPETKLGTEVLYFAGAGFSTCKFIPATASNLSIVRNAPPAPRLAEDEPLVALQ